MAEREHPHHEPPADAAGQVERIRRALAQDPCVGQLDVEVTIRGSRVLVTGYAVTGQRRDRIAAVVTELLPGYDVHNATETGTLPAPSDDDAEVLDP